jgi:hypothetical protein
MPKVIKIQYAETYKEIINWDNVTLNQFDTDWKKLFSGEEKVNTDSLNEDRLLVALLVIKQNNKLNELMGSLAKQTYQQVNYNLLHKAQQMAATQALFDTGVFVSENNLYLNLLENLRQSTANSGHTLFNFYEKNRNNFSATAHKLFVDYVEAMDETFTNNKKLKNQILSFISLNHINQEPEEDPSAELIANMEKEIKEMEDQQVTSTGLQPSVITDSSLATTPVPSISLSIDTADVKDQETIPSPTLLKKAHIGFPLAITTKPSLFTTFANKWNALPTRYKIAAAVFALLGLVSTVLGIVFPPSLTVTLPLLKVSSSSLLIYGGAALEAVTLLGHAVHISRQEVFETKTPVFKEITEEEKEQQTAPVIIIESAQVPSAQTAPEEKSNPSTPVSSASTTLRRHSFHHDDADDSDHEEESIDHCEVTKISGSTASHSPSSSALVLSSLDVPPNSPASARPNTPAQVFSTSAIVTGPIFKHAKPITSASNDTATPPSPIRNTL